MSKSLPTPGELISGSWKSYVKNWNEVTRISIRFVYIGIAEFLLAIAQTFAPNGNDAAQILIGILTIAVVIFFFQTTIRMIQTVLRIDDGKKAEVGPAAESKAWKLLFPLIWVGVLQGLIVLGAALPLIIWRIGFIFAGAWSPLTVLVTAVLAAPVLYVVLLLSFSSLSLIDADARGMSAVSASRDLVALRWAQVFWRELCGMAVFIVGVWIMTSILLLLLTIAIGPDRLMAIAAMQTNDPLVDGATSLINAVTQAIALPLIMLFQVKLYRSLQR